MRGKDFSKKETQAKQGVKVSLGSLQVERRACLLNLPVLFIPSCITLKIECIFFKSVRLSSFLRRGPFTENSLGVMHFSGILEKQCF